MVEQNAFAHNWIPEAVIVLDLLPLFTEMSNMNHACACSKTNPSGVIRDVQPGSIVSLLCVWLVSCVQFLMHKSQSLRYTFSNGVVKSNSV